MRTDVERGLKRMKSCDSRAFTHLRGLAGLCSFCFVLHPPLLFEIRSHITALPATAGDQAVDRRMSCPMPQSDKLTMQLASRRRRSTRFISLESHKCYLPARRSD